MLSEVIPCFVKDIFKMYVAAGTRLSSQSKGKIAEALLAFSVCGYLVLSVSSQFCYLPLNSD